MNIRKATHSDIPSLLRLLSQVLDVHHKGRPDLFKGGAVKYTAEELRTLLADPMRPVFVSENEDGYITGYCFGIFQQHLDNNILTDIKTLYIDDLCVDETCRGQHIGTALYRHAVEFARSKDCYNVTLNVWALNDNAIAFYKSLGMSEQKIGMEEIL